MPLSCCAPHHQQRFSAQLADSLLANEFKTSRKINIKTILFLQPQVQTSDRSWLVVLGAGIQKIMHSGNFLYEYCNHHENEHAGAKLVAPRSTPFWGFQKG
jgi:hypothetical protein